MQNEPNFRNCGPRLNAVLTGSYNEKPLVNQKITNPFEPKTNPIRTQFQNAQKSTPTSVVAGTYNEKPTLPTKKTNPFEPKANPIKPNFSTFRVNLSLLFRLYRPNQVVSRTICLSPTKNPYNRPMHPKDIVLFIRALKNVRKFSIICVQFADSRCIIRIVVTCFFKKRGL